MQDLTALFTHLAERCPWEAREEKRQRGLPIFRLHTWVCKPAEMRSLSLFNGLLLLKGVFQLLLSPTSSSALPYFCPHGPTCFFIGTGTCSSTHELIQRVKSAESRVVCASVCLVCFYFNLAEPGRVFAILFVLYLSGKSLYKHIMERQSLSRKTYGTSEISRI